MDHFLTELSGEMSDWVRHTEKDTTKIFYKKEEGFNGLTIYMEGVINAPLINLFSVLAEVELFKDFVPTIQQSNLLASVSHLRKLVYFKNGLPWPFNNREIFL